MATTSLTHANNDRKPSRGYSLLDLIKHARTAQRQRRALRQLDDQALKDIGISHTQAQTEATRRLWDVPKNWHR